MGLYALNQRISHGDNYHAGGKAMQDVFAVLREKGGKTIWSMPKNSSKYVKILDLPYLAAFLLFRAGKTDFIFYAVPENHIKIRMIKRLQKLKKYQIICFINDLNAFRYGDMESEAGKKNQYREIEEVGAADYVLAPNENTKELLLQKGVDSHVIPVKVWDYIMTEEQKEKLEEARNKPEPENASDGEKMLRIAFAGNLNKSGFLFHMKFPENVSLELWGMLEEEKKEKLPPFCHYHGVLAADEVPAAVAELDYGLVWDGEGEDEIEGSLGEYLRYNNSHKCGLYLASGLPAIVWSNAGMARLVKERQCGICIDRLSALPQKLRETDYGTVKRNAQEISEELQRGAYLSRAFDRILGGKAE